MTDARARASPRSASCCVAWLLRGLAEPRGSRTRADRPARRQAPWLTAGALAIGAIVVAALVVVSGVVPIKASSGHWAITAAFLDFAKTRSVATHSLGIAAPPLDDEALVLRGAGHYETAVCRATAGRAAAFRR